MQDYLTKLCKLKYFVSLVLVLNPVKLQLYPVLFSHLTYLFTFYVLSCCPFYVLVLLYVQLQLYKSSIFYVYVLLYFFKY
jgi:hypothetical protein